MCLQCTRGLTRLSILLQELPAALDSFNDICIENQRQQQRQQQTVHNTEKIRQIVDQAKVCPTSCCSPAACRPDRNRVGLVVQPLL